jgi:hypothetical protein
MFDKSGNAARLLDVLGFQCKYRSGGGCGSVVECGLPKPEMRVRFPSPAPILSWSNEINGFFDFSKIQNAKVRIKVRMMAFVFAVKSLKTACFNGFLDAENWTGENDPRPISNPDIPR